MSFPQLNTFQCILGTDGVNSFAIFLYADGLIQWTTGDFHGGTGGLGGRHAAVGFTAGNGKEFTLVPGSETSTIIDIDTTSNVMEPGVWLFCIGGETVTMGSCLDGKSMLIKAKRLWSILYNNY